MGLQHDTNFFFFLGRVFIRRRHKLLREAELHPLGCLGVNTK
jgi:hypothetical protein